MSGQISVTAGQVPELIKKNLRHPRIVTALCGDNGLGKSEAAMQGVEQYAEEIGMTCVDTREQVPNAAKNELGVTHMNFANYQPEDLQFPDVKERIYRHVISDILPFANSRWESGGYTRDTYQGVLICDEVGKNKSLFNNLSQWVCEGAWGNGEKLPAGLRIIFTTNDATHNAGAVNLTNDLINRICHVTVRKCVHAFMDYHRGDKALHAAIMAGAKFIGEDFVFTQSRKTVGQPFASPRSHTRNSIILSEQDFDPVSDIDRARIHGNVGTSAGTETLAIINADMISYDIEAMLSDPQAHKEQIRSYAENTTNNGKIAQAALSAMLVKNVKQDPSIFPKAVEFWEVMNSEEMLMAFCAMAVDAVPAVQDTAAYVRHFCDTAPTYRM